jgi:hypothetical protein
MYRHPSLYAISLYAFSPITRFRENSREKIVQYNFVVTVYGGGVTVWRAHQLVTSYQYQCEREC